MSINIGDWLEATRENRVVGRDVLLSEATKPRYFFFSRMMQDAKDAFKGGEQLVDHIQGETLGNAGTYNPTNRFNVSTRDTLTPTRVYWAFLQAHYPVVDEAAALNKGDADAFVDYMLALEQGCVVDAVNKMEELLWALPSHDVMEAAAVGDDPRDPYSLLCFATTDGLEPSTSNGGIVSGSTTWTTLMNVDPTVKTWWKNQFNTYSLTDPDSIVNGIVPAFDEMIEKVEFEMPGPLNQYADNPGLQAQVIATNLDGIKFYKRACRAVNDQMAQLNDPTVRGPQFNGVPLKYVSELDSVFTASQPEYLWYNLAYLKPFFHTDHFMAEKVTPGGTDHPNKTVVWKFSWYNMLCRSRRRQGRTTGA